MLTSVVSDAGTDEALAEDVWFTCVLTGPVAEEFVSERGFFAFSTSFSPAIALFLLPEHDLQNSTSSNSDNSSPNLEISEISKSNRLLRSSVGVKNVGSRRRLFPEEHFTCLTGKRQIY